MPYGCCNSPIVKMIFLNLNKLFADWGNFGVLKLFSVVGHLLSHKNVGCLSVKILYKCFILEATIVHWSSYSPYKIRVTALIFFSSLSDKTWATSWENLFIPYGNNKGADQPVRPRSLISAFVVRCLDSIIPLVSKSKISILYLASVAAQASLSLHWSQTPKTGFLMTQLTLNQGHGFMILLLVGF